MCTVSSQELLAVIVKLATRTYVRTMPCRLSLCARQHARELMAQGASVKETTECLHKEGIFPCRQTVWRFKRHYDKHGSIEPLRSSGRPTKLTDEVLQVIETAMQDDDETTAREISVQLQQHNPERAEVTWLDFPRIRLLSTYTCSEQREAIGVGRKLLARWF